jgi:hypothetical protein
VYLFDAVEPRSYSYAGQQNQEYHYSLGLLGCDGRLSRVGITALQAPWVLAPAAVLGLTLIGEARRAIIRHTCAGSELLNSARHDLHPLSSFTTT